MGPIDPSNPNFPLIRRMMEGEGRDGNGGSGNKRGPTRGGCGCLAIVVVVAISGAALYSALPAVRLLGF